MSKYRYFGYGDINLINVKNKLNREQGMITKPDGECLWASPIDATTPWEKIATPHFLPAPNRLTQALLEKSYIEFEVDDNKIYHIKTLEDALKYCLNVHSLEEFNQKKETNLCYIAIDFDGLRNSGYAGCEYHYSEDVNELNEFLFWDCDSIVIWNKTIISNITYSKTHQPKYIPNLSFYRIYSKKAPTFMCGDELLNIDN